MSLTFVRSNLVRVSTSVLGLLAFTFSFAYVEAVVWDRLYHFRFGWFDVRKSVSLVSFFLG